MLLCSLVCGPRIGVIASAAYLTVGVSQIPVFNDGGGFDYLTSPSFGYLAGFIPAAWISGRLAMQRNMNTFIRLTLSSIAGLFLLHFCGILNLILGSIFNRWNTGLQVLIFTYSLGPLVTQLFLCAGVGVLALPLRRIVFTK